MRSYYAHLNMTDSSHKAAISPRPIYRSSAIFPVFQQNGISTRLLFLGYWLLKRNIQEIACIVTLRGELGVILSRRNFQILEAKAYSIEAKQELENAKVDSRLPFRGSLEIEFFSVSNLVFPYPAVVVNYYGDTFSSVVHTAQRIYNDFEDMAKNTQTSVPESGFNMHVSDDLEPFISFINGPEEDREQTIDLQFFNQTQETMNHTIQVGALAPYQTKIIYPGQNIDLKSFFKGSPGACKARFKLNWVFPRLVVGNIQKSTPAISITHTYYDCSSAASDTDYWPKQEEGWHPASLMMPVFTSGNAYTNIFFYPIYSPSVFYIHIEVYDADGNLLGSVQKAIKVISPKNELVFIPMKEVCKQLNIEEKKELGVRLIAYPQEGHLLPARIKLGLDVGSSAMCLPSNICTNLQPFNPALEKKANSFKWAPILSEHPFAQIWIMNSTPRIDYTAEATVELNFFRESDALKVSRTVIIPAHGFKVISIDEDEELSRFLQNKNGWFTALTTNPYTTTYYFSNGDQVVGADHGF